MKQRITAYSGGVFLITSAVTEEQLALWQQIYRLYSGSLQPDRISGEMLDLYFRQKYMPQQTENQAFADAVRANILQNGDPSAPINVVTYLWNDDVYIGIDLISGFFQVESTDTQKMISVWDDLFVTRGLSAADLKNYVLTAQYILLKQQANKQEYDMTTPKHDGFSMPAEFSAHHGTIMIWPERPGSWGDDPSAARKAFGTIASHLAGHEQVYMLVNERTVQSAKQMLPDTVHLLMIDTDDSWARDVAPTFVRNQTGELRGIDWAFNAWGGAFDGLYTDYAKDDKAASAICGCLGVPCYDAHPFVLEGGAIHSDGEGTVLVTEACLLSGGRNPQMTKKQITHMLREYLGAEKVIWLPYGIYQDETNEHIDNVCAFVAPGEVVLAWCEDETDPQYAMSAADLAVLQQETDAKGRKLIVHKLPVPEHPVCITEHDLEGYSFAEGEAVRVLGERLAASYVNFYFGNDCVLLPQFGGENAQSDAKAREILQSCISHRQIIPIDAREILLGGGNIHCITQQIPQGGILP